MLANRNSDGSRHMVAGTHHDVRAYQNVIPDHDPTTLTGIDVHVGVEAHSVTDLNRSVLARGDDAVA